MSLLNDSVIQQQSSEEQSHFFYNAHFRSGKIILTRENINQKGTKNVQAASISNLELKGTTNRIKKGSVSRIDKFLSTWIKGLYYNYDRQASIGLRSDRLPVFITLTLPAQQIHPDTVIKRDVLMPFIQTLKRKNGVKYYFWKAELQGNYNIHFHLIVDHYIDRKELQAKWNRHLETLGYVNRFFLKHGHSDPPTTHVEKIDNMRKAVAYVCKYVCKKGLEASIDGRKWEASKELKNLKSVSYILDGSLLEYINYLIENEKVECYRDEWFTVLNFNGKFDYNADYQFIEGIEYRDMIVIYEALYERKPTAPLKQRMTTGSQVPAPRQLRLPFDCIPIDPDAHL